MKINEVARLTGLTVRTLQYYDKIGLLKPEKVEDNGYRFYSDKSLVELQQIMFLRELDFSLAQISEIIADKNYNRNDALKKQKQLLGAKRDRLNSLIELIDSELKGEKEMSFKEFDTSEIDKQREEYAKEAREKWGATKEYAEFEQKSKKLNAAEAEKGLYAIIAKFAAILTESPSGENSQALVREWQDFITANYYTCTKEMLPNLAAMYTGDERFRSNIDRFGEGTAQFIADAIAYYCK